MRLLRWQWQLWVWRIRFANLVLIVHISKVMPISSITVAYFFLMNWSSDWIWTHSLHALFVVVDSWGVCEEALDAHSPEQWSGGTGVAVSLQPAGSVDQSSGPSGETLTLMLNILVCLSQHSNKLIYISSFRRISNRTLVLRSLKVLRDMVSLRLYDDNNNFTVLV